MLRKIFIICSMAALSVSAEAQAFEQMTIYFKHEIARWKVQQSGAEQDIKLADSTYHDFVSETKFSKGPSDSTKVNRTLLQLNVVFPNIDLTYRAPADYCPIVRAIERSRREAVDRLNSALETQNKILLLSNIYMTINLKGSASDLTGSRFSEVDIGKAFQDQIKENIGEEISTGNYGGMGVTTDGAVDDCR